MTPSKFEQYLKGIEVSNKVLKQMRKQFTSHQFANRLRSSGVPESFIKNDKMRDFLMLNCDKVQDKRTWIKRQSEPVVSNAVQLSIEDISVETAIQIIKKTGQYKIMRRQEEWQEI